MCELMICEWMCEWCVKQYHALQWSASNENAQGQKDEKKTEKEKKPHETNSPLWVVKTIRAAIIPIAFS